MRKREMFLSFYKMLALKFPILQCQKKIKAKHKGNAEDCKVGSAVAIY